jgi:hypothetical protein
VAAKAMVSAGSRPRMKDGMSREALIRL